MTDQLPPADLTLARLTLARWIAANGPAKSDTLPMDVLPVGVTLHEVTHDHPYFSKEPDGVHLSGRGFATIKDGPVAPKPTEHRATKGPPQAVTRGRQMEDGR